MVFVVLFFIPVLVILLIAAMIPPQTPREFKKDDRVKFTHWPGRTAKVARFWGPADAAKVFPHGVKGAAKPPYRDGVVEATFEDLDPNGKPWPVEIAAGTSVQQV